MLALPRLPHHLPQSNTALCEDTADLLGIHGARRHCCLPTSLLIRTVLLLLTDVFFMNTRSSVLEMEMENEFSACISDGNRLLRDKSRPEPPQRELEPRDPAGPVS